MKRILISGYYGFANLGDEAVLAAIIQQLRAVFPGVVITVLSANPKETAASHNVLTVDRWKAGAILKAMRRCDVFVSGGGSLLQDITGSRSIQYYLGLIRLARFLRKKVFIYAQGVGPLNAKKSRRQTARVLKKCSYITLRDEDSAALLASIGVPPKKIMVSADPVLSFRPDGIAPPLPVGLKMAFALRPWSGLDVRALAKVADHFSEAGYQIVFLPFCDPDDLLVCKLVAGAMKHPSFVIESGLSPSEMLSAIASCQMLVGVRLHSLVMAAAAATPFIGLSYDPKIDSFCAFSGQRPAGAVTETDWQKICREIEAAIAQKGEISRRLKEAKPGWEALCRANAELLRECSFGAKNLRLKDLLPAASAKEKDPASKNGGEDQPPADIGITTLTADKTIAGKTEE